jgi:hypothetical protein
MRRGWTPTIANKGIFATPRFSACEESKQWNDADIITANKVSLVRVRDIEKVARLSAFDMACTISTTGEVKTTITTMAKLQVVEKTEFSKLYSKETKELQAALQTKYGNGALEKALYIKSTAFDKVYWLLNRNDLSGADGWCAEQWRKLEQ